MNHTTGAQRYNARMDRIFEQAKINNAIYSGYTCEQCGESIDSDLLAMFTKYQVCKICVKKNHRKATR